MRKRTKLLLLYFILFVSVSLSSFISSKKLFIFFIICNVLAITLNYCLGLLNKVVKETNWYKNIFIFTAQFVSNAGYRADLQRNYDIVNLGSNPARFAFFYESVIGQNWSTGTQGLVEDLEILKYYFSYIKKGGVVLMPIVPFTSISSYLKYKPAYTPVSYYSKFVKILDGYQARRLPLFKKAYYFTRYPLFIQPKALRYLIRDVEKDNRLYRSEQVMQPLELNNDANKWIGGWMKEFDIDNLTLPLNDRLKEAFDESVKNLRNLINFCVERDLRPVIIIPPVTKHLSSHFTAEIKEQYIYSFIHQANTENVLFLDYFVDERFQEPGYYFNSFFLNLRGRKLFTRQVLQDLGII
jgi:hypothetical protein